MQKTTWKRVFFGGPFAAGMLLAGFTLVPSARSDEDERKAAEVLINQNAQKMVDEGRQIFRFDTFGDQVFWGDTLMLHQTIEGAQFGGVGGGISPNAALALGLKVDAAALSAKVVEQQKKGKLDLNDPAM